MAEISYLGADRGALMAWASRGRFSDEADLRAIATMREAWAVLTRPAPVPDPALAELRAEFEVQLAAFEADLARINAIGFRFHSSKDVLAHLNLPRDIAAIRKELVDLDETLRQTKAETVDLQRQREQAGAAYDGAADRFVTRFRDAKPAEVDDPTVAGFARSYSGDLISVGDPMREKVHNYRVKHGLGFAGQALPKEAT